MCFVLFLLRTRHRQRAGFETDHEGGEGSCEYTERSDWDAAGNEFADWRCSIDEVAASTSKTRSSFNGVVPHRRHIAIGASL